MNEESQKQITRRGFPVYLQNPSLEDAFPLRPKQHTKALSSAYMISPETGEVLGKGAFGFIEEQVVDSEQFLKVYLNGIKQFANLSKAGAVLFELLYNELSGLKGKDTDMVTLNHQIAMMWKPELSRATFFRGMKELLEKEFLFRSISADQYFFNVRFMYNGNRMVLIKSYTRKNDIKKIEK